MRTIIKCLLLIIASDLLSSCVSSRNVAEDNNYKITIAFEGIRFFDYNFFWATDKDLKSYLILSIKDMEPPNFGQYEKIIPGKSYYITLSKADTVIQIKAADVDVIVDDYTKEYLYKDDQFLIPLYTSPQIYGTYILK